MSFLIRRIKTELRTNLKIRNFRFQRRTRPRDLLALSRSLALIKAFGERLHIYNDPEGSLGFKLTGRAVKLVARVRC